MATNVPSGFDAELEAELTAKLGSTWADKLMRKWGYDWAAGCEQAMIEELGADWADESAENKAAALYELVGGAAEAPKEGEPGEDDESAGKKEPPQGDPPALDDLPWVQSFTLETTFEAWLRNQAGVDMDAIPASALSDAADEAVRKAEEAVKSQGEPPRLEDLPWIKSLADASSFDEWLTTIGADASRIPAEAGPPSLEELPWIKTLADASTFEGWLTRIGVDTAGLPAEAKEEAATSQGPPPALDELPWVKTLAESANFEEWLTRIGVDTAGLPAEAKEEAATSQGPPPALDDLPAIKALADASGFEDWLTRIGVDTARIPAEAGPPALDDLPAIKALAEAESFERWLTRVGVDMSSIPSQG